MGEAGRASEMRKIPVSGLEEECHEDVIICYHDGKATGAPSNNACRRLPISRSRVTASESGNGGWVVNAHHACGTFTWSSRIQSQDETRRKGR